MTAPPLRSAPGRLHVLTDETLQSRFTHRELARHSVEGGADVVQYREKRALPTADLVSTARALVEEAAAGEVAVIVNDRVDVAIAAGAFGVHLGRCDLDVETARRLLGGKAWIGTTANDLGQAQDAAGRPVDYLGVGPVFGTRSKVSPAPALGLEGLRAIATAAPMPVIAIGNLTPDRVGEVLAAGAHGVAVLSDVILNRDPARRVAAFREAIEEALRHGNRATRNG